MNTPLATAATEEYHSVDAASLALAPFPIGPIVTADDVEQLFHKAHGARYRAMIEGSLPPTLSKPTPQSRNVWAGASITQALKDRLAGVRRDWGVEWPAWQGSCAEEYDRSASKPD